MDDPTLSLPRRSQRLPPAKAHLNPHFAVFPDPTPPPSPPPQPHGTPRTPTTDSPFDYFGWQAVQAPVPSPDLSCAAPVGALDDLHNGGPGAEFGAWYAFENGFQSDLGAATFPDHVSIRPHSTTRKRRVRKVYRHKSCLDVDCSCPRYISRPVRDGCCGGYVSSDAEEEEEEEDVDPEYSDEPTSAFVPSDAVDTSDANSNYLLNGLNRLNLGDLGHVLNHVPPNLVPSHSDAHEDITAEQAANGMDVQGIPWNNLSFSREDYRAARLRDKSRHNFSRCLGGLRDQLKEPKKGARFFDFFKNTRRIKCSIVHFQLRNLAWATSKHDVFVMHEGAVVHWDAASKRKTQVLDLSGSGTTSANGLGMVQISTMIAKDDLVIAGGFYGEMVAKNMKSGTIIHNKRITYDENAITNAIDIYPGSVMTSNNDRFVRCFDLETFERKASFEFDSPVNHATRQPEGKMVSVAGDKKPVQVIDGDSGDRIALLHGHEEYSFATGWHPSGRLFATGSQDHTCRVWDVRNMSQSISILGAHTGAVRSLRFSACGRFLVMAEPRDYVHIFGVNGGEFDTCQEIDLFGEIAGIALTPCAEGLYIGVNDRTYSSLIEYERKSSSPLSDLIF